ncbi:hypothetical protein V6Z88_002330 [Aspergillus fumigatus]
MNDGQGPVRLSSPLIAQLPSCLSNLVELWIHFSIKSDPLNEENINVLSSSKSPIPPWANSTTPCRAAHLQGKANNFIMSIKSSIELHPSSPSLPWQLSTPIHDVVLDLCLRHSCTVQNTSRPLLS